MSPEGVKSARDALVPVLRARARSPLPMFLRAWILTVLPLGALLAALALRPHDPLLWLLTAVLAGLTQNALGILMHEGCHYFFHRRKAVNDLWANLLVCLPIFNTVQGYRRDHFNHHRSSGDPADPYYELYGAYPTRGHLLRGLIWDSVGLGAVSKFLNRYGRVVDGKTERQPAYALPAFLAIQIGLAGLLYLVTGRWYAYLLLWLLPLLTVPIAINRVRTVAEHFPGFGGAKANRTSITGIVEYLCIAPYGYSYHLEHHLWPQIPYYELAFTHRFLVEHGLAFTADEVSGGGYFRTFRRLLAEMEDRATVHEG